MISPDPAAEHLPEKRRLLVRLTIILMAGMSVGVIGWVAVRFQKAPSTQESGALSKQESIGKIRELGGRVIYDWQLCDDAKPPDTTRSQASLGRSYTGDALGVSLNGLPVTDSDLRCLTGLHNLVSLRLDDTKITDDGVKYLRNLRQLRILWLSGTRITDEGLGQLDDLENLQALFLTNTQITDTGLEYLSGLHNLELLSVLGTRVTNNGVESLKHALPDCRIAH